MTADIPCPMMFEMVSETRKSNDLQNLARSRGLTVHSVRNEFGGVTATQIVMSALPDRKDPIGFPKYVSDQDALKAAGADFTSVGEPVLSDECKPQRDLDFSSRWSNALAGYVLIFNKNDGERAVTDAKRLSLRLDTFVGTNQLLARLSLNQKTTFIYRVKRGDYGKLISAGALIAGDTILRPQETLRSSLDK